MCRHISREALGKYIFTHCIRAIQTVKYEIVQVGIFLGVHFL